MSSRCLVLRYNLFKFKRCKGCNKKILLGILCNKCIETITLLIYTKEASIEDVKKLINTYKNKDLWKLQKSGSQ